MSDQGREGARLDEAIDRAVRGMLGVEPPAGLRRRVLERIGGARPAGSTATRRIAWLAVPLAAAAMLVLAVFVAWRPEPTKARGTVPTAATTKPAAPVVRIPEASGAARTSAGPPLGASRVAAERPMPPSRVDRRLIIEAAMTPDDASAIDPLSPIAPIAVSAVRPPDIAPHEIAIAPLTPIAEVQVPPLSPPERRN